MTTQLTSELTDKIDDPINQSNGKGNAQLYVLWYRERANPHPLNKFFPHKGDLNSAIARGRQHCMTVNQVFIHVRPFITDLDQEERRIRGNID